MKNIFLYIAFSISFIFAQEQVAPETIEQIEPALNDSVSALEIVDEEIAEELPDTSASIMPDESLGILAVDETVEVVEDETNSSNEVEEESTSEMPELAVSDSSEILNTVNEESVDLDEVVEEPQIKMLEMGDIPDSLMGLEYGYKGYKWGTPAQQTWPKLKYMGKAAFNEDKSGIIINGKIEGVPVTVFYSFSDSGFWKVEIDYDISEMTIEDQVELFTTVEKNLAENYGNIKSTSRNLSGPHANRSGYPVVKFKRAYYHSSWAPTPCKIELVLFSLNQTTPEDLKLIENGAGFLKLVYFNPDYMVLTGNEPEPEKLPTIFEIY